MDSSCLCEQLSCTKYFHPSYGYFYINFQSFKPFYEVSGFIIKSKLKQEILLSPTAILATAYDSGANGDGLTHSRVDWSTYKQYHGTQLSLKVTKLTLVIYFNLREPTCHLY